MAETGITVGNTITVIRNSPMENVNSRNTGKINKGQVK
jgi:hypothetical protein